MKWVLKAHLRVETPRDLRAGLVSIGLPVYNGARYLREALDSLVAQKYQDFEIIISDNASDDETEAICREYLERDRRVRYYRSEENRGPLWNSVRVYELARGEYFMWAAHDDRRHPEYLSRCVPALANNPHALFCCTAVRLIDELGNDVSEIFPFRSYPPTGPTPRERLRALTRSGSFLHVYSLIRTPQLARTVLGNHIWGADVVLMADLCLRGEGVMVPEQLFEYRYFAAKTSEDLAKSLGDSEVNVHVGWSDLAAELMESVQRSPLGFWEKLSLKWMIVVEFCLRNRVVGWGVREERFKPARLAFTRGDYRRAVTLMSIGLITQMVRLGERVINSMRYRGSKLKTAISTRMHSQSRRKPDY